ncbi:MAG: phosphopentomutase [Clostridia bacterium]|nr:phosphopentomutase [Clostridia bacterium]
MKRVFLIVLDSVGVGELPDAERFGDKGSDTMRAIFASPKFHIPNLLKMGLGNIEGIDYLEKTDLPLAAVAKMAEQSNGKDTTIGHWEIAGVVSETPLPTYPDGFPSEVLDEFTRQTGRGVLCNLPYSGTDVIRDYGEEHIKTGKLIVYTSADSVFQIAAHEDVVDVETLYEYCRIARKILVGKHAVGRVIARPFVGKYPNFTRSAKRHDFSVEPPKPTMLDRIRDAGLDVISVGKINDIFAGKGITEFTYTHSNKEGMELASEYAEKSFTGLCFVNLVDFDMTFGHRNDVDGYANALSEFDLWLGEFCKKMKDSDVLIVTADHGCDPSTSSTDHSREYTPLVIFGNKILPVNLGVRATFSDIAATVTDILGVPATDDGTSFADDIIK